MWMKRWEEEPVENAHYFVYSQSHGYEYATYAKLYGPYNQRGEKTRASNTRRQYHPRQPNRTWSCDDYGKDDFVMGFIVGDGWSMGRRILDVLYFMEIPDLPEVKDGKEAIRKQMMLMEARIARLEEQERIKDDTD